MKLNAVIFSLVVLFSLELYAQDASKTVQGTISFVTSNNVYVRFDSTENIAIGKTLQFAGNDCLLVTEKSSSSIVCSVLNNCPIQKGDVVTYTFTPVSKEVADPPDPKQEVIPARPIEPEVDEADLLNKEKISGRVTLSSYNSFSDVRDDRHRFRTRFSLNADHIGDSKFSIESFLVYRNLSAYGDDENSRTNIFNVYNLNVRFDATPDLLITAGRKINPKTSSIGAVDGLQVEKYFGNFYVGGLGGFRPDFEDYGFNSDLL